MESFRSTPTMPWTAEQAAGPQHAAIATSERRFHAAPIYATPLAADVSDARYAAADDIAQPRTPKTLLSLCRIFTISLVYRRRRISRQACTASRRRPLGCISILHGLPKSSPRHAIDDDRAPPRFQAPMGLANSLDACARVPYMCYQLATPRKPFRWLLGA